MIHLSPSQSELFEKAKVALTVGRQLVISGPAGIGKSTILSRLRDETGGVLLSARDFVDATRVVHPLAAEEAIERLVRDAGRDHEVILFDDLHLLEKVLAGDCGLYPRSRYLDVALKAMIAYAEQELKRLVFTHKAEPARPLTRTSFKLSLRRLEVRDYAFIIETYLGGASSNVDPAKLYRFAPKLDFHQLSLACRWLKTEGGSVTTDRFIDYLSSQRMASNVDLAEVQAMALEDLRGVEDVIESLEANIIVPLEDDKLAAELHLRPKRGVLLAGPPGTGKTTIGRALAHRLKGKFFLLDGTVIYGTRGFYEQVDALFREAKLNAPSVLFIDDCDVIFQSGEEHGLYRYLLTMLDGLESESAGQVCVMLTAMDVSALPPALVRSGRIELWLEMRLPDREARREILCRNLATLPASIDKPDVGALVERTEGFTGADLKRLVEDGKNLLAYDKARGKPPVSVTEYFVRAVAAVEANKEKYSRAEALARERS